jgi:hypothetical protein
MIGLAHELRSFLYPFLVATSVVLALLLAALLVHRLIVGLAERRQRRLQSLYEPLVDRLLLPGRDDAALDTLRAAPRSHRAVIAHVLLAPLDVTTGETPAVIRDACLRLGLDREWRRAVRSRRWWERAAAARALGAIQDPEALGLVLPLLGDDHEETRSAAVEALGLLQNPRALPSLTALLSTPFRHQRARVVEALRRFGEAAVGALIDRAAVAPQDRVVIAELLGLVGSTRAVPLLLEWVSAESPALRAAAMLSLGAVGLDDRSFYYAMRALEDGSPDVRAAAARAIGRARRDDGAPYLERLLDDEWMVAAQAAAALRQLGTAGHVALRRYAGADSQAGDLARQMLWERRAQAPSTP